MMFAPTMDAPRSLSPRRRAPIAAGLGLFLALSAPGWCAPGPVQDAGRPDQIFRVHPRTGKITALSVIAALDRLTAPLVVGT